jgi:hypothetical protein
LTTALEVIAWVIVQDAMEGVYSDPVSVPEGAVEWIRETFERRAKRQCN